MEIVGVGQTSTVTLDVLKAFPLFAPNSGGLPPDLAVLTLNAVNQTIPLLRSLAQSCTPRKIAVSGMESFPQSDEDKAAADDLRQKFNRYGSDKSTAHDYHLLYGPLLKQRDRITAILEIGLGTNNPDVVSNMGIGGSPGASLRAFRDFLPAATIYGADIDRRILFSEDRIATFFVDQTAPATFLDLAKATPSDLDLVIDDGLHCPPANIATLQFGLEKIRIGGWVVIEDIARGAVPVWELVAALLPDRYRSRLFSAKGGVVFAVERLS